MTVSTAPSSSVWGLITAISFNWLLRASGAKRFLLALHSKWNKKPHCWAPCFFSLRVLILAGEPFFLLTVGFVTVLTPLLSLYASLTAPLCFWCLISLSVADITLITQGLLVNQLVIQWKGRLADNATTESVFPAGIIVPSPKKSSSVRDPKFLFESTPYLLVAMAIKSMTQILARVPPCLSFILFLPLLQGPRPSLFVSQQADSHSPTPTIPLSSLLWCCRIFTLPPALTLSAKWHFTGCFLSLIPPHFAFWDSIKAFIKHTPLHKASVKDRNKFQLLSISYITSSNTCVCAHTPARTHTTQAAINNSQ